LLSRWASRGPLLLPSTSQSSSKWEPLSKTYWIWWLCATPLGVCTKTSSPRTWIASSPSTSAWENTSLALCQSWPMNSLTTLNSTVVMPLCTCPTIPRSLRRRLQRSFKKAIMTETLGQSWKR
jgi:hypothetical protein